jgi:hypothetical protein
MSVWDKKDKNNYENSIKNNIGQISDDSFSEWIIKLTKDTNNKNILEIGTWNGLGSTKQFVNTLRKRKDNYIFYSLECNKDKCKNAQELYKNDENIFILNEVLWNKEPNDFYSIFPEIKTSDLYKKWNEVDLINMKKCKLFLERENLPEIFDIVLLDGGEFTTYFEYKILKNRCKYLLLDDTNVNKCKLIVKEIKNNKNEWEILEENKKTRNGFMICKNKKYE